MGDHLFGLPFLDDPTEVHDRDSVRHVAGHGDVVGDEHVRHLILGSQVQHQVHHTGANRDVEHGDRLIGDDHLRVQDDRPRDGDPLSLSPRQLMGETVEELLPGPEARILERADHEFLPLLSRCRKPVNEEGFRDRAQHAVTRVQGFIRVLEDHLQIPPEFEQLTRLEGREIDAAEQDPTLGRGLESGDEPTCCRLSATALPDEPQDLASLEAEVDSVHRFHVDDVTSKRSEKSGPEFEVLSQAFDPDDLAVLCDRDAGRLEARGGRR